MNTGNDTPADLQIKFSVRTEECPARYDISPQEIAGALNELAARKGWPAITFYAHLLRHPGTRPAELTHPVSGPALFTGTTTVRPARGHPVHVSCADSARTRAAPARRLDLPDRPGK
ncbi:hypothetical protein ACFU93_36930 [Streptomyces sp. NPDC057611]|uniref:hypothetical protein n=1 Tax=Streptomyces sp. NPDC057611 TaxID=3346182 RepID=UPI003674A640